jgi:heme-degrading monooxygenase HmoA
MYATIRTYTGASELTDALLEHESEVRELLTGIAGFRAYYLVRTETGATTISVFDDRAGAEESTRAAAAWVGEHLGDAGIAPPQVATGEVAVSF